MSRGGRWKGLVQAQGLLEPAFYGSSASISLPPLDSVYWSRLSLACLVLYSMSLLEGPAMSPPSLQGTHTKSHLQEAQVVLQPH